MTKTETTVVYEAEWPGFGNEPVSPHGKIIRIDLHRENHQRPQPDWPVLTKIFETEEAKHQIFDYEEEIKKPLPVLERPNWRQRAKQMLGKANEMIHDVSVMTLVVAQTKAENVREYYADREAGSRRKKISGAIAGVLAVGAATYFGTKGLMPTGASHQHAAEAVSNHVPRHASLAAFPGDTSPTDAGARHMAHVTQGAHQTGATVTVHEGENPWTISEHHLMATGSTHPDPAQIEAYDRDMAHVNSNVYTYGSDSSRHIPVGTELKLP